MVVRTEDHAIEQDARLILARALTAVGDPHGAYEQLDTLRNKYPRSDADPIARGLERSLLAAHPEIVDVESLEYRLQDAQLLLKEAQAADALAQVDAAILLSPPADTLAELKWIEARAAQHYNPPRAERALLQYLAIAPHGAATPAVLDRLARFYWNQNDTDRARVFFRRLVRDFPSSSYAPDAMFAIGRTFEDDGDLESAGAQYERTCARYPASEAAAEARFRAAFTLYESGEFQSAARRFAIDDRAADGSQRDMFLYWRARALENAGEAGRARLLYEQLAVSTASNYYPSLASRRVAAEPAVLPAATAPDPSPDAPHITEGEVGFHLARALALRALELRDLETAELNALEDHCQEIPSLREFLLASYQDAGAWYNAISVATRMEKSGEIGKEVAERLRYPRAYWDLIAETARRQQLDPYLLLSLTRQESLFNPEARSSSDARGLMQLLPVTAHRVSGAPREHRLDLFDAATSVELGSSYLRQLIDMFNGNRVRAVAAYNAGEHAVQKWNAKFPGDDDQWVENIGYRETREYVKKVIGGLREYQLLYQSRGSTSRLAPSSAE